MDPNRLSPELVRMAKKGQKQIFTFFLDQLQKIPQ